MSTVAATSAFSATSGSAASESASSGCVVPSASCIVPSTETTAGRAVLERRQARTGAPLGVVEDGRGRLAQEVQADALGQLAEPPSARADA